MADAETQQEAPEMTQPHVHRVLAIEEILVGHAAADAVATQAVRLSAAKVVVLTSRSLAEGKLVRSIKDALGRRYAGTYAEVRAHSPRDCVLAAAALARTLRADLLVAVGGGSVIDAAKVAQLCLWHELATDADLRRYQETNGTQAPTRASPRMIAVPTTLSAAEFNSLAGVTDPATKKKEPYEHPLLVPQVVVLDPDALAQSPPELILSTGIRTVDHCVEGFCSLRASPYYDALALHALRLLWRHLPQVKAGTADRGAYSHLQIAAWMAIAGPAAGIPVGASHALGRVVGAVADVAHGHTSAILLPAVQQWNAEEPQAQTRQSEILRTLGLTDQTLADGLRAFIGRLGQPQRLSDVGVTRAQLATISKFGLEMLRHPSTNGNARPVGSAAEVQAILELAW